MTRIGTISGFLGADRTAFIKKLLEEAIAREQVVLIENELGEIGIDGGFLKGSGIEIREINSGCICCSLMGDFGTSLAEVPTQYEPERIIIEPSGVDKLSDVMKATIDVSADVDMELNSTITIVDAARCKMYVKDFGEFFSNQVENARTIILSCADITDASKIQRDVDMIREKDANAVTITTPLDQPEGSQFLETIGKKGTILDDLLAEVRESRHHDGHGKECYGYHHDHDEECHEHHHDHDEECHECYHDHDEECHEHHHRNHDERCHEYYHGHDKECHERHHHDHNEECHEHHHGHDEECHEHHHHDYDEGCHRHHHDHGEECHGYYHHDGYGHEYRHHHHADEVFTSQGMEAIIPMVREQLEDILKCLSSTGEFGNMLRAKGMLPTENPGEWLYFDLVPEQYEIRQGKPDYTGKVCVTGASLKEEELNSVSGRG